MRSFNFIIVLTIFMLTILLASPAPLMASGPPTLTEIGGQKVLTFIGRDPPGVRCNNNMQVAAELANVYKIPVIVVPQALAGPGAKAPAIYYGSDLLGVDGGEWNGMASYTQIADILEMDGVPKHAQTGRLMEKPVKSQFDTLKASIKDVK